MIEMYPTHGVLVTLAWYELQARREAARKHYQRRSSEIQRAAFRSTLFG